MLLHLNKLNELNNNITSTMLNTPTSSPFLNNPQTPNKNPKWEAFIRGKGLKNLID